jgi:predicted acyltransferase
MSEYSVKNVSQKTSQRYLALDALRGLTIALMLLVNSPGSWDYVYTPLLHADWHGSTPTDLVFPFFLFIIGSAMYFSFKKSEFRYTTEHVNKVLKRGTIIFFIGLALNAYPFIAPFTELRILGVMQRIGIAYAFAGIIVLVFKRKGIFLVSVFILLTYWLLLLSVGSENAYSLENNIVRQFDIFVFGEAHIYGGKGLAFDPEGLLSTVPAVVNILFGFEITRYITTLNNKKSCVIKLLQIAAVTLALALLWQTVMPINKSLWTSSYVLFSSAMACLVLAFFIYIIDIKGVEKPLMPLFEYGTNPLFIYILSWLWLTTYLYIDIGELDLYQYLFNWLAAIMDSTLASFVFAFSHVSLFWYISRYLYRRGIFIKI